MRQLQVWMRGPARMRGISLFILIMTLTAGRFSLGEVTTMPAISEPTLTESVREPSATSMPATPVREATSRPSIESMPIRANAAGNAQATGDKNTLAANGGFSGKMGGVWQVVQVFGALGVVLGLVFLGRALVKKYVPGSNVGSGKGVMEILARYPLAKNQSLVLMRIGSQLVVLNQGKETSQSVLVIQDSQEVAQIIGQVEGTKKNSIQGGFNRLLATAQTEMEQGAVEDEEPTAARLTGERMGGEDLESELADMDAAKRQLMDLREQVRAVRDSLR